MKLEDLEGKAFVVGGASRGLGRATATELVAQGARVLLVSRTAGALEEVAAELGERATFVAADLSAADGPARIAAAARDAFDGALDGVVVNGGGPPPGRALELDDDQWQFAFDLLVRGPIRLLRELVPMMGDAGSVVFITSSSVRQPIDGLDTSNVLRPGVAALGKVLARELGPAIRVNTVGPGRFDTDRVRELDDARAAAQGVPFERVREESIRAIPLGRLGEPAELARVAAFLLSDASSYVTGAALGVDGGAVTALP